MCINLLFGYLNSGSCLLHPTNTYTYRVTITPTMCDNIYGKLLKGLRRKHNIKFKIFHNLNIPCARFETMLDFLFYLSLSTLVKWDITPVLASYIPQTLILVEWPSHRQCAIIFMTSYWKDWGESTTLNLNFP